MAVRTLIESADLGPVMVEDEVYQSANEFGLAGQPGNESEIAIVDIARNTVDEIDEGDAHTEMPRGAAQALASWDRILENGDSKLRALQFTRAATEVLRLASSPLEWQQLVDVLYEMGERHGLQVPVVRGLMAAANQAAPDRRSGEAQQSVQSDADAPPVDSFEALRGPPDAAGFVVHHHAETSGPAPLQLVCPLDWRDVPLPPMRWLATHRIPAADATILSGDGGGGKTTVALQLAVAVEQGLGDWLGTVTESGPVIFFSAEEPEHEMRRRLQRVARKRGIVLEDIAELHFHFASPENCLLAVARADGIMGPTPLFDALAFTAAAIRPVLIVVDSIAATFGGNQNDRVHARTFVSLFRRLAQDVDCAVLLLDHPSLSGITSGSGRGGSMDWQNATRARLHLETVQGSDGTTGRVLEIKKSNYGPVGDKVTLQWEDGCFVVEGSDAGQASPYRAAAQQGLDDLFVRLLEERNAQGRWVTPSKAAGYAPKELAAMQGAGGATAIALAHAMERLLTAKRIIVETFGPPSKRRQRLVVTLPTTLPTDN